jgi:FkbM family methyltransferase
MRTFATPTADLGALPSSDRLMRKPTLKFTGGDATSAVLQSILRLSAQVSSVSGHRGYGRFLHALSRIERFRDKHCTAILARDSAFGFHATDPYWGYYMYTGTVYEQSLHRAFAAVSELDYQVLDCGANYGYWSVLLSGPLYGKRNVIAVEASADTFGALESNCELNSLRFMPLRGAVSGSSGQTLWLDVPTHDQAHVSRGLAAEADDRRERVQSISLDDLAAKLRPKPSSLVIKLDVEGHEVEALKPAECLRDRDALIIFEDHGLDFTCRNSAYMLNRAEFVVFWIDDNGCSLRVKNLSEIRNIKKPRNFGYNFFAATRDGEFHRRLFGMASPGNKRQGDIGSPVRVSSTHV